MRDENVVESIIPKGHQRFQGTCVRRGLSPKNQEPRTENREPRIENQEPRTQNPEPRTKNPELKTEH